MGTKRSTIDSFSAIEQRISITQRRLPGFPAERVSTMRLIAHLHKRGQVISNAILKSFGLNSATYGALMMLLGTDDGCMTVSQLADAAGEKRANMTRICDELLAKGLIERAPSVEDRRAIIVGLTAAGHAQLDSLMPALIGMIAFVDEGCPRSESRLLLQLLRRLVGRMDAHLDVNPIEGAQ